MNGSLEGSTSRQPRLGQSLIERVLRRKASTGTWPRCQPSFASGLGNAAYVVTLWRRNAESASVYVEPKQM